MSLAWWLVVVFGGVLYVYAVLVRSGLRSSSAILFGFLPFVLYEAVANSVVRWLLLACAATVFILGAVRLLRDPRTRFDP